MSLNKYIITKLQKLKPVLNDKYGLERFGIFGSQVRDDWNENSDVDIIIFEMKNKSFDNFMELKEFLENKLEKKIDIGFYDALNTYIKNKINKEILYV